MALTLNLNAMGKKPVVTAAPEKPVVESTQAETPKAPAKPLTLGGLKLNTSKPSSPPASPPQESAPKKAVGLAGSLAAIAADESASVPTIEDLAFPDEVPATAPVRNTEGLDEQQLAFVQTLDGIYSVMSDPELFGQMIRNVMIELQSNQEYKKLLADDDVAAMIRGMRESMGLARMKKVEGKTKRAGGAASTRKSSPKQEALMDDLAALAAQFGGSFD